MKKNNKVYLIDYSWMFKKCYISDISLEHIEVTTVNKLKIVINGKTEEIGDTWCIYDKGLFYWFSYIYGCKYLVINKKWHYPFVLLTEKIRLSLSLKTARLLKLEAPNKLYNKQSR